MEISKVILKNWNQCKMFFRSSFNYINEFYFILKNQIRKIYLSSSIYNKKISQIDENILVYQPSFKILSSLIKYENNKYRYIN